MAIPPFSAFMRPVLLALDDGETRRPKEVREVAVVAMNLTDSELQETIKGGSSRANSRAHWAIEYLVQSGAVERPRRGELVISDIGRRLLADHPDGITESDLKGLRGYQEWAERSRQSSRAKSNGTRAEESSSSDSETGESPLERLIEAIELLDRQTAQQLVERLQEQPPAFLERAVLRLLNAMGYGGSEKDGEHLGRSHDGGIDGVIRQDALGLERVYLQAKRYSSDNTVGSAAISLNPPTRLV